MNKQLLGIICCPACKHDLKYLNNSLICKLCKSKYPIIGDIPILLSSLNQESQKVKQIYEKSEVVKKFGLDESFTGSVKYRNILRNKTSMIVRNRTRTNGIVVDVGCGNGLLLESIAKNRNDLNLIGIDFSLPMLLQARERLNKFSINKQFIMASADALPIKSNNADASICIDVLHHFSNKDTIKKSISELIRIVKPQSYSVFHFFIFSRIDCLIRWVHKTLNILHLKPRINSFMKDLSVNKLYMYEIIKELKKNNTRWKVFKISPLLNWALFLVRKK